MTKDEAITKLKECQKNYDIEAAHAIADDILCDLLEGLGYEDVVKEYYKVSKWYA